MAKNKINGNIMPAQVYCILSIECEVKDSLYFAKLLRATTGPLWRRYSPLLFDLYTVERVYHVCASTWKLDKSEARTQ